MAILNKITVEILVDGLPSNEYEDDDDDDNEEDDDQAPSDKTNMVKRYIEVKSGAAFAFKITVAGTYAFRSEDRLTCRAFLDGKASEGVCFLRKGHNPIWNYTQTIEGTKSCVNGQWYLHPYAFADLATHDLNATDDKSKMKQLYGRLGELKLEVWRERQLERTQATPTFEEREMKAISEKALKGRPLDVTLTTKTPSATLEPRHVAGQRLDGHPIAVFKFKYRTRRALQSLMIIERSPSPVPLEDRPVEDLTRDELQDLVRRQRAIKKEISSVKRERSDTYTPGPPIKSSRGPNGKKIYHLDSDNEET